MKKPRLTKPLREAIIAALNAALAGDGFDGGDFTGMNEEHFDRALDWVNGAQTPSDPASTAETHPDLLRQVLFLHDLRDGSFGVLPRSAKDAINRYLDSDGESRPDLAARVAEFTGWRRTGLYEGTAMAALAATARFSRFGDMALREAEDATLLEAAVRLAALRPDKSGEADTMDEVVRHGRLTAPKLEDALSHPPAMGTVPGEPAQEAMSERVRDR